MSVEVWQHKTKIGVRLATSNDQQMNGFVFCADDEDLHDVMNDNRPYLLFQANPKHTELINKKTIVRVRILDNQSREMENYSHLGTYGTVTVVYMDGTEMTGRVCPRLDERVSDILNKDGNFFLFIPEEGSMNYVSTAYVERIIMHADDSVDLDAPLPAATPLRSKIILPGRRH